MYARPQQQLIAPSDGDDLTVVCIAHFFQEDGDVGTAGAQFNTSLQQFFEYIACETQEGGLVYDVKPLHFESP